MRRRSSAAILSSAIAVLAACGEEPPVTPDAGVVDGGIEPPPPDPRFRTVLDSPDDLAAITSTLADGAVKYLARVEGKEVFEPLREDCYFQNMRLFPWHLGFLQSFEEHKGLTFDAYLALVLRPASRRLWGGAIRPWPSVRHPITQAPGIIAYVIYSDPNTLKKEDIIAVDQRMRACVTFADELLVYVPESPDQKALLRREQTALTEAGVATLFPEQLLDGVDFVPYSRGENYGTLKIFAENQPLGSYGPRDVVIVDSSPNDISVVSGMITKNAQNPLGHVNLRLREKGIPNIAVPDIYEAAWVRALENSLVHVIVADDRFVLEPARLEDAERFWEANRPVVRPPEADLSITELRSYTVMRAADRRAYGTKAANLGELHAFLEAQHRNDGFGIPFSAYDAFIRRNNLQEVVDRVSTDPRMKTDPIYKLTELETLRDAIRDATVDPAFLTALRAKVDELFGPNSETKKMRFRSSTNVEDLDVLTGAGPYESRSGCFADELDGDALGPSACLRAEEAAELQRQLDLRRAELTAHPERLYLHEIISDLENDLQNEKEISRALKKVWASLWSVRAYDEREYYGIDHRLAFMGIAVNPSFVLEKANGVAVSNLIVDAGAPLYRLNSQVGTESVVQPADPTAVAELLTFRRENDEPTDVRYELGSSLLEAGEHVWTEAQLTELAHVLFRVHDHFSTAVYPNISPLALDFEVKLTADDEIVVKQVRPYVSKDP